MDAVTCVAIGMAVGAVLAFLSMWLFVVFTIGRYR